MHRAIIALFFTFSSLRVTLNFKRYQSLILLCFYLVCPRIRCCVCKDVWVGVLCVCVGVGVCVLVFLFQIAPGSIPTLHPCISADWLRPWSPLLLEQRSHSWWCPGPWLLGGQKGILPYQHSTISAKEMTCCSHDRPDSPRLCFVSLSLPLSLQLSLFLSLSLFSVPIVPSPPSMLPLLGLW